MISKKNNIIVIKYNIFLGMIRMKCSRHSVFPQMVSEETNFFEIKGRGKNLDALIIHLLISGSWKICLRFIRGGKNSWMETIWQCLEQYSPVAI